MIGNFVSGIWLLFEGALKTGDTIIVEGKILSSKSVTSQLVCDIWQAFSDNNQNLALTPDIQVIFNPALNPDQDAIAVLGIRTRLNF